MPEEHYYHKFFKNIHSKTLRIVQKYVEDKHLWTVDKEEGFVLLNKMADDLADVYDIPHPKKVKESSYEWYRPSSQTIGLPKVSLVSFLHEFRHHMQYHGLQHYDDKEIDARGWSVSVFYLALPDHFAKAWRNDWIWFMKPYNPDKL